MPLRCNCPRIQKTLIKFSRSFMRCTLTPKNWEINSKWCQSIGQYLSFVLQMHLCQCLLDVLCHLNMLLGCTNMVQWSELINELSTFVDSPCIRMAYAAGWCTGWRWALACCQTVLERYWQHQQHSAQYNIQQRLWFHSPGLGTEKQAGLCWCGRIYDYCPRGAICLSCSVMWHSMF